MHKQEVAEIISEESEEWRQTEELLDGPSGNIGVLSLSEGTEILNGSRKQLGIQEFHIDNIEAVRGDYLIFPEYMVEGVDERVGAQKLGPEDLNEANFYVGHSSGVPWFELKIEENYSIPNREMPHVHDAWEFYSFQDGTGVLDVADQGYDFTETYQEMWGYRSGVSQVKVDEGQVLGIPPGVPHKVNQQEGNPQLVVARYADVGEVGRYDLEGDRIDPWAESTQDIQMQTYQEALK